MDLVPGKKYLLKWSSMYKTKPKINNLLILECEFLKYRDDTYYDDYLEYDNLADNYFFEDHTEIPRFDELRRKLAGKILTEDGESNIEFPFDSPFFPYAPRYSLAQFKRSDKVGLFSVLGIFKTINKGVPDKPFSGYNLNRFFEFSHNVACNTWKEHNLNIIPNETLLWVDLNNTKIIEPNIAQRILEYKTLTKLENKLPADMTHEIAGFIGSEEYLTKKYGGKKSKNRKNKSKKMYKKTKKNKGLVK